MQPSIRGSHIVKSSALHFIQGFDSAYSRMLIDLREYSGKGGWGSIFKVGSLMERVEKERGSQMIWDRFCFSWLRSKSNCSFASCWLKVGCRSSCSITSNSSTATSSIERISLQLSTHATKSVFTCIGDAEWLTNTVEKLPFIYLHTW